MESWPKWVVNLIRRIVALPEGRWQIIVTKGDKVDWTVNHLGKVEQ